jgi:hypothetical protein
MEKVIANLTSNASEIGVTALAVAMIVKSVLTFFTNRAQLKTNRLPLKRAHDEHVEKMTEHLREISVQQERTAIAVEKLDGRMGDVASDVNVLLDRGGR